MWVVWFGTHEIFIIFSSILRSLEVSTALSHSLTDLSSFGIASFLMFSFNIISRNENNNKVRLLPPSRIHNKTSTSHVLKHVRKSSKCLVFCFCLFAMNIIALCSSQSTHDAHRVNIRKVQEFPYDFGRKFPVCRRSRRMLSHYIWKFRVKNYHKNIFRCVIREKFVIVNGGFSTRTEHPFPF